METIISDYEIGAKFYFESIISIPSNLNYLKVHPYPLKK